MIWLIICIFFITITHAVGCIEAFYVLVATSTKSSSGTECSHLLEITLNDGQTRSVDVCGVDSMCSIGAVDYFTMPIELFKFPSNCITEANFEGATKLKSNDNDGWRVASVYLFADTCGHHKLLTADPVFNEWIDIHQEHVLTTVNSSWWFPDLFVYLSCVHEYTIHMSDIISLDYYS